MELDKKETYSLPELPENHRWRIEEDDHWGTKMYRLIIEEFREDGTFEYKLVDVEEEYTARVGIWPFRKNVAKVRTVKKDRLVRSPGWARVVYRGIQTFDEDGNEEDLAPYVTSELIEKNAKLAMAEFVEAHRIRVLQEESKKFVGAYPPLKLQDL